MTTAKSIPGLLRELADTIERALGSATHAAETATQRRRDAPCHSNAEALAAEIAKPSPYALPSPNIARNHIVLIMSAELHSHDMQKIETIADNLENAFHYLSRSGLHAQALQIEPHGLGDLLIQFLNRKGITTQSLAKLCKPFACSRHPEGKDAAHVSQQHGGQCGPIQKQQPLGPQ